MVPDIGNGSVYASNLLPGLGCPLQGVLNVQLQVLDLLGGLQVVVVFKIPSERAIGSCRAG